MKELTRNMYILLSKFAKENDIKMEDAEFLTALKNVFTSLAHNVEPSDSIADARFARLHEEIVQKCIDFVRDNSDIQEAINTKVEEVRKDLMGLEPDVRISFCVDCFDESIKAGEWVPVTDSYLGITVGNEPVIESL